MPDKFHPISFEEFCRGLNIIRANIKEEDKQFVYSVYSYTVEGISDISETNVINNLQNLNHLEIIGYAVGEFLYHIELMPDEQKEKFKKDENVLVSISSMVADKYLSLNNLSYNQSSLANRFSPQISTLYVYINFMLNIVESKWTKKDPKFTLLSDLFMKSISIGKCTLDLLVKGFNTEAFSCWRTLHECECTLQILSQYGEPVVRAYLKHMQFGIAFRDSMTDKEEQTKIFMSMKEEMKEYDLKSKDIKKYIEYGWLYSVPGVKGNEKFKLNFRDGLEMIAGLSEYNKRYEMSSEIIHGTPLLVYSSPEYFYFVTLLSTYESFFRLEKLFTLAYSRRVSEEEFKSYLSMREVYFNHLISIHKRESARFKFWQQAQRKNIEK